MNIKRIALFFLTIILLFGCSSPQAVPPPKAAPDATQPPEVVLPPTAVSPAQHDKEIRGSGSFDLQQPAVGLDGLTQYKAILNLVFEGTNAGQLYTLEKVFEQTIDREQDGWLLKLNALDAAGQNSETLAGRLGTIKYAQAGPDQPCQASSAAANQANLFEPARMLPHFLGASEAGEEMIGAVNTRVYTFDQSALGIAEGATANGKVWIAQPGNWIVRYELSLKSDIVFGEGITGEQRWNYQISEVGTAKAVLPNTCPQVVVDLPVPDGAKDLSHLPGSLKFKTEMDSSAVGDFYMNHLLNQDWTQQGDPVETSGGTRWLYSTPAGDQEWVVVITVQKRGDGQHVTIYKLLAEPPPPAD
jgi:hypothetical protein